MSPCRLDYILIPWGSWGFVEGLFFRHPLVVRPSPPLAFRLHAVLGTVLSLTRGPPFIPEFTRNLRCEGTRFYLNQILHCWRQWPFYFQVRPLGMGD